MRNKLGGLAFCAVALLACGGGGPHWRRVNEQTYAIECGRHQGDCYLGAARTCPYGYDQLNGSSETTGAFAQTNQVGNSVITTVQTRREGQLVVRCREPIFCESQPCPYGSRCVRSVRFPGRNICSIQ